MSLLESGAQAPQAPGAAADFHTIWRSVIEEPVSYTHLRAHET